MSKFPLLQRALEPSFGQATRELVGIGINRNCEQTCCCRLLKPVLVSASPLTWSFGFRHEWLGGLASDIEPDLDFIGIGAS